jgi:uncharacterized delta-60 repeat protein
MQWLFNTTNFQAPTLPVLTLTNVQATDAGDYSVVVMNSSGSASATATLKVKPPPAMSGKLDPSFNAKSQPSVDDGVMAIAVQSDGKAVIGGSFKSFNGVGRTNLARLDVEGNLDPTFDPHRVAAGSYPDWVKSIVMHPDGSIILGGYFSRRLGRLDTAGNIGANSPICAEPVNAVALQGDGKFLVGTAAVGGKAYVYRYGGNGYRDSSFRTVVATASISSIAVQPNDKIVIAGAFTKVNDVTKYYLARVHPNGYLDSAFNTGTGPGGMVDCLALQPDGKIVIGGRFNTVGGVARKGIARLNPDGSLDPTFDPGAGITPGALAPFSVVMIVRQPDGKLLVCGSFVGVNGVPRNAIARLHSDGSLDTSFDIGTGANGIIYCIALLPDERIIIGGDFTTFNGIARNRLARLFGDLVPPRLTNPSYASGVFSLTFESAAGQGYVLEFKNALDEPAWVSLVSAVGDGAVKNLADTNALGAMRYYRIRCSKPGE